MKYKQKQPKQAQGVKAVGLFNKLKTYQPFNKDNTTPRTREGKTFPGGRHLRRALKNLNARRNVYKKDDGTTQPGSMKS